MKYLFHFLFSRALKKAIERGIVTQVMFIFIIMRKNIDFLKLRAKTTPTSH